MKSDEDEKARRHSPEATFQASGFSGWCSGTKRSTWSLPKDPEKMVGHPKQRLVMTNHFYFGSEGDSRLTFDFRVRQVSGRLMEKLPFGGSPEKRGRTKLSARGATWKDVF